MDLKKYNELKEQIRSGKGIQFEGRSAATVAELDWIAVEVYGLRLPGYVREPESVEVVEAPAKKAEVAPPAPPVESPAPAAPNLSRMKLEDLRAHAVTLGIEPGDMTKGQILDAIAKKAEG